MVDKERLASEVRTKAALEAKARSLDEDEARDLAYEAEQIIEDFFGSIVWTEVREGIIQSKHSVASWKHRAAAEFERDWQFLELHRRGLKDAANRYLDRPWMQCDTMDWLILNVLTYAKYHEFVDSHRSNTLSPEAYLALKVGGPKSANSSMRASLTSFLKLGLWVAVLIGLAKAWFPLAFAWGAYWCWSEHQKSQARIEYLAFVEAIWGTYRTFDLTVLHWGIVWDQLVESSQKGVVWDGLVFRLAEQRKERVRD